MELKLPGRMVSRGDLNRISRELNKLNDVMVGSELKGAPETVLQQNTTPLLSELANLNGINLGDETKRRELNEALGQLVQTAPALHISFTSEPSPNSLDKLITWLRANIHPQVLLSVGLQPSIAAGCVLRTPNRVIDMGLKQTLIKQQPLLLEMIKGVAHE